jgi:peptide/nickel transport system substrate-binding protein
VKHTLTTFRHGSHHLSVAHHPAVKRMRDSLDRVRYSTNRHVELYFDKPFGPVLETLAAIPILPAPKTLESLPSGRKKVVGTGPFRFVQWWPQEKIVIARWRSYWGQQPQLERVEFKVIPSLTETEKQLRQGELDLVLDLDVLTYKRLLRTVKKLAPVALEPAGYGHVTFNSRRAPFDDRRVRRAISLLIDREKLLSPLPGPRPNLVEGPAWRHGPQRRAMLGTGPRHDPAEAARLLRAAGWKNKAGQWIKAGIRLKFTLLTAERSLGVNRGLRALRRNLKRAGIRMRLEKVLWGQLVVALRKRDFDAIGLVTPLQGPWADLAARLHSKGISHGGNHSGVKDAALDKLLARILKEVRDTKRSALERLAFKRITRLAPLLPLHAHRSIGLCRFELEPRLTFNWMDLAALRIRSPARRGDASAAADRRSPRRVSGD